MPQNKSKKKAVQAAPAATTPQPAAEDPSSYIEPMAYAITQLLFTTTPLLVLRIFVPTWMHMVWFPLWIIAQLVLDSARPGRGLDLLAARATAFAAIYTNPEDSLTSLEAWMGLPFGLTADSCPFVVRLCADLVASHLLSAWYQTLLELLTAGFHYYRHGDRGHYDNYIAGLRRTGARKAGEKGK